ncbi:MAG: tetratricopeptide repeat protein [Myxococcota bacterium]
MRGLWVLATLLACSGQAEGDPALNARKKALDAWERGAAHLDAGAHEQAAGAFGEALSHRPADPVLLSWRARAEAASGRLDAAVLTLDEALAIAPDFREARYNRAAYLARDGQVERAAEALARAVQEGMVDPRTVLGDPDFVPHLGHPSLAFLPSAPLDVTLKGPGGAVFVGSDAVIRLTVQGPRLGGVSVSGPPSRGPFHLARVEERLEGSESGEQVLTLTWTLRALGPGSLSVGPLTLSDSGRSAQSDVLAVVGVAPEDHPMAVPEEVQWALPSTWVQQAPAPPPAAIAWRDAESVWVRAPASAKVEGPDGSRPDLRALRLRDRDEQWALYRWSMAADGAVFRVSSGGQTLFEGLPQPLYRAEQASQPD